MRCQSRALSAGALFTAAAGLSVGFGGGAAHAAGDGGASWAPSSSPPPPWSAPSGSSGQTAGRPIDTREVIVPVPGAERMRIDNPLGSVTVRAWDRTDAIHIIAEKSSASAEVLGRLRVHFTAWAGGEVSVETRVEVGGRERALPLAASRVDLVVEVPAMLEIAAKTFAGDLSASGLRAGARLETTGGRIGISDVHGRVVTRQLRGGQTVLAVDGDVDLDGVEGQMRLERVEGSRLEARVVDGDIRAVDIGSREVRLLATTGQVVLLGVLRPGAHYDLRSYSGEVRLALLAVPPASAATAFELRVRSPVPVNSSIPLRPLSRQGDRMRAIATLAQVRPLSGLRMRQRTTGVRVAAGSAAAGSPVEYPVVELTSVLGRVVLTSAAGVVNPPGTGVGIGFGLPTGGAASRPF
ncbi:MAG: hypothetical protein ABI560_16500 [Myxococcales bacterium]